MITISPVTQTTLVPTTGSLTSSQVGELQTALSGSGIAFSGSLVQRINLNINPDLSARYTVWFRPSSN